jgi:DNA-binding beta-propeller fold protein YncE
MDAFGRLWVTCEGDDAIWVLDAVDGGVVDVLGLGWGSAPASIVFGPGGNEGYVANRGNSQIQRVDAASISLGDTLDTGPEPRGLAVSADGQRLLVTQFISTNDVGTVRSIDLATFTATTPLSLPLDSSSQDGSLAGRGLPNYLAAIAIDPQGQTAWVVAKKDNTLRGAFRDGQPLTFETTTRALISQLDLDFNEERVGERIDIDNHGQPSAVAISNSGEHVFITMQGNNRMIVLNPLGNELLRVETGLAPQGIAIDPLTQRLFTKDLMGRTITAFDGAQLLVGGEAELPQLDQISTVSSEKLGAEVLRGKQIFYNAADSRMGRDGYLSCAICHSDGEHDGQTWDFTDRGEGLRNTISLKGQGGDLGAPLHWSGNFDEVQDFENDIRNFFGGDGFMDDSDYFAGTRYEPLGDSKAGLSADLDALAAYVNSLTDTQRSPHRQQDGSLSSAAQAGESVFATLGCETCHSGERFSDSSTGVRHDVGTIKPSSGHRMGFPLDGFDTPMLPGLWATAPYLHDGSAATLRDVLVTANENGLHGDTQSLSQESLDQLIEYLLELELE